MKRLSQEQWMEYNNAPNCLICAKPFKLTVKKRPDSQSFGGLKKVAKSDKLIKKCNKLVRKRDKLVTKRKKSVKLVKNIERR